MNTRKLEITVGLFVALGIAALVMLALSVSNLASYGGGNGYQIQAHFDNIGGLKQRAPVSASGVRVGQVVDISYNSDSYEAIVTMEIEPEFNRFPLDTAASIMTSGLLGEQYVALEPGADIEYLKQGDRLDITQSALVLEQIIGQFLYSLGDDDDE